MKVYYFSEFPYHEYPDVVLEKIRYLHQRLGMEHLIFYSQESRMSHQATMSNIGLFGKEVLPEIHRW